MIRGRLELGVRGTLLVLVVAAGVALSVSTELLSLLGRLERTWLLASWAAMLGSAGIFVAAVRTRRGPQPAGVGARRLRGLDLAMAGWIAVLLGLTGAIALFSAPITWDSMTYHLARVAHWAQNHSVAFYATPILRQLYQPPLAGYAILHLFILAGGDRLANLVQWIAMAASLVGVTVIARQLGAGMRGQLLSAFVCATIPMGLLQSATTQNDYAASLWLVCLASALLAFRSRPAPLLLLGVGASLGLALLTKSTAYVFAAPFVVTFMFAGRWRPIGKRLGEGLVVVLCALALNAPQYARNVHVFGAPLGPGGEGPYVYRNEGFSPAIAVSNVVRNLGLHAGTPWPGVNARVERIVAVLHRGIGIALDDPRSTWPGTRFAILPPVALEDLAGNGIHLLLVAAAMGGVWRLRDRRLRAFAGCLLASFLLFCVLLRWQPWHSRLHLPLFVLGAPLVGVVFERLKPVLLALILLLAAGSSGFALTRNPNRPLAGPRSVFATTWANQRLAHAGPAYGGAAGFVVSARCHDVGLALGSNDREYFLWGILADAGWRGHIEPVLVTDVSARFSGGSRAFLPCAIVRQDAGASAAGLTLGLQSYRTTWSRDDIQVLVPDLARPQADRTTDPRDPIK